MENDIKNKVFEYNMNFFLKKINNYIEEINLLYKSFKVWDLNKLKYDEREKIKIKILEHILKTIKID